MPPPAASFEALQDVLKKRKGLDLNTASSRALADSLDGCVVSIDEVPGGSLVDCSDFTGPEES